jgi:hypothetical protein
MRASIRVDWDEFNELPLKLKSHESKAVEAI